MLERRATHRGGNADRPTAGIERDQPQLGEDAQAAARRGRRPRPLGVAAQQRLELATGRAAAVAQGPIQGGEQLALTVFVLMGTPGKA